MRSKCNNSGNKPVSPWGNGLRKVVHEKMSWLLPFWRWYYSAQMAKYQRLEREKASIAYAKIDARIASLKREPRKLRVGFYVYNCAVFQLERVFQQMLQDSDFDPFIIVSFCNGHGSEERQKSNRLIHDKSVNLLRGKYGANRVLDSWEGEKANDYSDMFDLCASMRPYEDLIECCNIRYLARKGIPVIYAHYGFEGGDVADEGVLRMPSFGYLWRFYMGNKAMKDLFDHIYPLQRKRHAAVLSGNPKIEPLAFQRHQARTRKRIIISPHHTIDPAEKFHISNFVRFSDFLLSLPERYPTIDWVFRPHPNLMTKMVDKGYWTAAQREQYLDKWRSYANAEYQEGGDYYEVFVNSDALIQDCSSFLAEYHATGHPQCYMLKDENHAKTQYNGFGLELLDHAYKAYSEGDIISFIDTVVVAGKDTMKEDRRQFLEKTLLLNFPHVSEFIVADIKRSLTCGDESR